MVRAAVDLGVPATLDTASRSAAEVASAAHADAPSMARLLDALVALGVCTVEERRGGDDRVYGLAGPGRLLVERPDEPSLGAWARWSATTLWDDWRGLAETVRSGRSARRSRLGADDFGPLAADPAAAATFDRGLAAVTALQARSLVEAFALDGDERIADLGGGQGELLVAVLDAHPDVQATLVELPHAIDHARARLSTAGLDERVDLVAGDLFAPLPVTADVVVVKSVLHDWDDDDAGRVLATAAGCLAPGGRLLVVERVRPDRPEDHPEHRALARMDLTMMVGQGGRERTEGELTRLVEGAGLRVVAVARPSGAPAVLDARR